MPAEASCAMATSMCFLKFDPPKGGFSPDRPPVGAHGDRPSLAELFGSPLGMALGAEAADVAVLVRSAKGQRHNMVRHGRLTDNPGAIAITAEGFSP